MKKIIREMTNVERDRFDYDGRTFRLATKDEIERNQGTSAHGIWNVFTDGEDFVRIYKADVHEFNPQYAVTLFNGIKSMTVTQMREALGFSKAQFSRQYDIPPRTLESWETGERQPAPYVLKLLERVVREDLKK